MRCPLSPPQTCESRHSDATPHSGMLWRDDGLICTVRALTEHTDICTTVLACPPSAMEQLQRVSCTTPAPAVIRELQSLFGTVRRSYRPLLELHPSVPLELAALLRRRSAPPSRGLDIVLCRCREPLGPLLRLAPALLPRHARLRIFVYERCGWQPQGVGGRLRSTQPMVKDGKLFKKGGGNTRSN